MSLKNKIFQIVLRIICSLMLIVTIFLGIIAAFYSLGGGVPNIFGSNIYLVKTDAFDLLHNGTALVARQVHPSEIQPGNIVIFNIENNMPALGEIRSADRSDGVYSFTAATENNKLIVLSQSQIVAKGVSFSDFWGAVISFAVSPIGMLIIAVLPCLVVIIVELSKFVGKIMPQPEIETVKKQLEVPTYSPEFEKEHNRRRGKAAALKAYGDSDDLDDSIGLYDAKIKRSTTVEREVPYRSTASDPLFSSPKQRTQPKPQQNATMPLSSKKLEAAIAASKAERELLAMSRQREETVKEVQKTRGAAIAAEKEQELMNEAAAKSATTEIETVSDIGRTAGLDISADNTAPAEEEFKPVFKAPQRQSKSSLRLGQDAAAQKQRQNTTSIPRLDALLSEDNEPADRPKRKYDIDDILAGIDKKG